MVGLGEEWDEVVATLRDLRRVGVQIVTIGQYLRPSIAHLPMVRYYTPAEFAELKRIALDLGFGHVESGPLVRSSYHAHEQTAGRYEAARVSDPVSTSRSRSEHRHLHRRVIASAHVLRPGRDARRRRRTATTSTGDGPFRVSAIRDARLLVLGLAPAAHGANRTGRVFTGDGSGDFLDARHARARLRQHPDVAASGRRADV